MDLGVGECGGGKSYIYKFLFFGGPHPAVLGDHHCQDWTLASHIQSRHWACLFLWLSILIIYKPNTYMYYVPSYVQKSFISFISTTAHLCHCTVEFFYGQDLVCEIFKNCENCINSNYCYSCSAVAKTLLYLAPLSNPYLKNYK